jgi:hypothetical protein
VYEKALSKVEEEKTLAQLRFEDKLRNVEEDYQKRIKILQAENAHVILERNLEMDKNLKVQEIID